MQDWRQFLEEDGDSTIRIKKRGEMLVDGVIVSDRPHLERSDDA